MRPRSAERTGAAIRKLRLAKGWTLAELSTQTGVPLSTLSRVELGQNALNYDKLVRLCRALDVDLQDLVAREAETAAVVSGRRAVVRAGEGERASLPSGPARAAATDLLSRSLSPVVVEVGVASLADHGPLAHLEGEAYLMVLAGEIAFHNHLYAPLSLGVGDAVYFDGRSGYALVAPAGPAKVLLVAAGEQSFDK
jgi:transcriptional regulator with XRE-family HTH domain